MSKYKVLVTARSFGSADEGAIKFLEENDCEIVRLVAANGSIPEQLEKELPMADAVIAGLEVYDRDLIESASNLKVISRYGVGYDKVDLEAASNKGVAVTFTPGANGDSVADMAVALMLNAGRCVAYMDQCMKAENQQRPIGVEMWEKTLGVIGAGRIGQGVARRCRGFNMRILCYDTFQDEAFKNECAAEYTDIETIIKEADFITIHSPLNDETRNMFSTEEFKAMKKNAVIVNTARGGIIDEAALYEALKSGEIAAAGLDVTVDEPSYGNPLLTLSNCTVTPHAGAATYEASSKMSMMAAKNVVEVLATGKCNFIVNK
ncbi:D-3-phosphoglycerate dehydrogenase [Anaerovirgula multivorans]|uniref:D-3-phosphoglycerate dehydrogenase n=1 Tax=Anaerovirgula multivorans TaxID=312168 RepID=A0A239CBY0_9FIRM|nr:phosphoglycerate dehydrogenase [Anaerovirgula multivorans]SNS17737.1 D-3-phosphoglycerate dehydrogenase [Anaerovirgula multivorans]